MKYEKSCGAVIWRNGKNGREYLIILNKKGDALGHWGFPKGHVEENETEYQTARREILEETGLSVDTFDGGFRKVNSYSPRPGVEKDAVYFLAQANGEVKIQAAELADYKWLGYEDAMQTVTHDGKILAAAHEYLNSGHT